MKKITTSIFILILALTLTAQSTKQVLHTVHREYANSKTKTEYVYNELGKEEKFEESFWDASLLRWYPNRKIEQTYDALGNLTSYQDANWDDLTLRWIYGSRYEYFCRFGDYWPDSKRYRWDPDKDEWEYYRHFYRTYNDKGKISESFYMLKIQDWISWKEEFDYDDNNNLIKRTNLNWDENNQKWELDYKSEYQYDADNQKIEEQYFRINDSQIWEEISKRIYTYTPTGEEASHTDYDIEDGEWIRTSRTLYEYNATGKITLDLDQAWQEDFEEWANIQSLEYTYDPADNQITSVETRWDFQTLLFYRSFKYEREFDQNNNLTHYTFSVAAIPGQFFPFSREDYTYDYEYQGEDIIPVGNGNMLIKRYREEWNQDLNDWEFDRESIYEYSPAEIRTPPTLDANYVCVNVHPNPATDYITFRVVGASTLVQVRLLDATGKVVGEEILGEGGIISLSHLQRGVYFYQLMYNGTQRGGKFMVK